jgi:hypothetical protein
MIKPIYHYVFSDGVSFEDVEASLLLAVMAAECLHGAEQARLDISHFLDHERRCCVIDAATRVGRDLNRFFVGFLRREFGDDAFQVRHAETGMTESTTTTL